MSETKHTPGPYWAERADEYDRKNGRLHLRSIVLAPPLVAGEDPEPVAYVDTAGDTALLLAAPDLLAACERAEMALLGFVHRNEAIDGALADLRAAIAKGKVAA